MLLEIPIYFAERMGMGRKKKREKQSGMTGRFPMEDMALKASAQGFGSELIPKLGIEQKVAGIAPTER